LLPNRLEWSGSGLGSLDAEAGFARRKNLELELAGTNLFQIRRKWLG
jgi:hypothetical protein